MEITPHFDFYGKNYQWHPLVKAGKWDGVTRLMSNKTGRFYTGLLKQVILKCKELGYHDFRFEGFEGSKSEWVENDVLTLLDAFKLPNDMEIREHQLNAILTCLLGVRRLILSPTSSGKSLIIYSILRALVDADKRILLIVPNSILVDQMFLDFEYYSKDDSFNVEEHSHKIYTGLSKKTKKQITISTWQSIDAIPKGELDEWLSTYECLLVDEVHGSDAKVLKSIIEKSINAKYRFGFTGTLKDCTTHELVLTGLFGTIKKMISIKELMDMGIVAKLKIKCIILKYPEEMRRLVSTMDYDAELATIINYKKRNQFIANLANSLTGNTLTIIRFIEKHAEVLKLLYEAKNNRKVILLTGETDKDEKTLIRQNMEVLNDTDLMGSWGLVSTGMSIVNLHNGIFASPSKSVVRVLQGIGRLLRVGKNKTTATQYDIVDNLTYDDEANYLMRHFYQRYKYYKNEGFDVEIIEINIE